MYDTIIVGAGMSGLVCARALKRAGQRVFVVDKGRGVGGRMATRRVGEAVYDHGAQFFTVRTVKFRELVDEMIREGIVREWFRSDGRGTEGHPRYCGTGGMTGIAKYLARECDYSLSTRIERIIREDDCWCATSVADDVDEASDQGEAGDSGEVREFRGKTLVVTAPIPQILTMLSSGGIELHEADADALGRVQYSPCLALLGCLSRTAQKLESVESETNGTDLTENGRLVTPSPLVSWVADNADKGISPVPALTIHCTPAFSSEYYEAEDEEVITAVSKDLSEAGLSLANEIHNGFSVKRWRYARPVTTVERDFEAHSAEYMVCIGHEGLVLAGDAFVGSRVEAAALSGFAAASHFDR